MRLEKAKDITKLRRQIITDKNGHRRTVWVKINEDEKKGKRPQQELPPQIKEYLEQIEEGTNLEELYQYVFPGITDQKILIKLVEKAVDKGQDLRLLYQYTVFRITDQKVLENLLEKAIDRGAREEIIYLFRILPKIHNQKTLIRLTEKIYKNVEIWYDSRIAKSDFFEDVLPAIEDQKVLESFFNRIIDDNIHFSGASEMEDLFDNVFKKINNPEILENIAIKAIKKRIIPKYLYGLIFPEIGEHIWPKNAEQKVLIKIAEVAIKEGSPNSIALIYEKILPKIENQKFLTKIVREATEKGNPYHLESLYINVFPKFKTQKIISEIVIDQINELSKFKTDDYAYTFEQLRSFPVEIKNKIIKEYADWEFERGRRTGISDEENFHHTSLDAYLDELEAGSITTFQDPDSAKAVKMTHIIQDNVRDKVLRLEQILDRVVPIITEPDFFNKIVDKIDPLKVLKNFPKSFHEQAIQRIVQKRNLRIEDNQEVINRIQDTVDKTFDKANHKTLSNYEIVSVVKYGNKNFNKELAIQKNNKLSEPIFHEIGRASCRERV